MIWDTKRTSLHWTHYANDPLEEVHVIWISLVKDKEGKGEEHKDTKLGKRPGLWKTQDHNICAVEMKSHDTTKLSI